MASTYIYKDMTGNTPSTKMTFSCWLKKTNPATDGRIFGAQSIACHSYWLSSGELRCDLAARDSSTSLGALKTNRVFKDTNAWYHIVYALDTTLSTADDRLKIWVNGVQETSFAERSNPTQNGTTAYGDDGYYSVGARMSQQGGAGHYFDGLMSHVHYCDGYAYDASAFGSTDATTGEWKINTSPSVTHGTNGFFLKMENSANMDLDSSTNNHSFTTAGTLTKTEDCPSNVFCTLNPLTPSSYTFSNGNNTIVRGSAVSSTMGTIAPSSGKWYWEVKLVSGQSNYPRIGIYKASNADNHIHTTYTGNVSGGTGKWWGAGTSQTGIIANGTDSSTAFYSYSNGDILMFAMDNDNGKLWFGKNGTWYTNDNSTTTTGTAIGNGTATPAFSNVTVGENWSPSVFGNDSADVWSCNFGNGYFGTSQVASAGTNASGIGIFEYDVPPNFTAISTKGLNE